MAWVSVCKAGVLCSFAMGLYRSYVEHGTSVAACTICKYSQPVRLYIASCVVAVATALLNPATRSGFLVTVSVVTVKASG